MGDCRRSSNLGVVSRWIILRGSIPIRERGARLSNRVGGACVLRRCMALYASNRLILDPCTALGLRLRGVGSVDVPCIGEGYENLLLVGQRMAHANSLFYGVFDVDTHTVNVDWG